MRSERGTLSRGYAEAMATVLRVVDVETQDEVARATLDDAGQVSYSGGGSAKGIVEQRARVDGTSPAAALRVLARDGWSNGYLMVALDGYPRTL
jgi:hypothetical protein